MLIFNIKSILLYKAIKTLNMIRISLFILVTTIFTNALNAINCHNHDSHHRSKQTTICQSNLVLSKMLNTSSFSSAGDFDHALNEFTLQSKDYTLRTVVLDAGHGGKDNGCSGSKGSSEKKLTLEYTLLLGSMISRAYPDVEVIYTRKKDEFIELHERANIANRSKADLFISIHCNWNPNSSAYGTETYVLGLHRAKDNLEVAKRENASILLESDYDRKYEGFDPNSPEGNILLSISQNAHIDQSISIADKIESEFVSNNERYSRGVRQAGFLVLRQTSMPAILIETGFLSNIKEESYMTSEAGKAKIVRAIFSGFEKYKKSVEFYSKPEAVLVSNKVDKPTENIEELTASVDDNGHPGIIPNTKTSRLDEPKPKSNVSTTTQNKLKDPIVGEIEYCVQLLSSSTILDMTEPKWATYKNIIARSENNVMKYQAVYKTMKDAITGKEFARNNGFPDAFIVVYQDGRKIDPSTAQVQ